MDEMYQVDNIFWYQMEPAEVLEVWQSDEAHGLDPAEAGRRREVFGPNVLEARRRASPLRLFLRQFTDFMVLVLLGAAGVSALLGEWLDAGTMLAIVFLNAVLGFIQEFRAEKSLEALQRLSAPEVWLRRGGERVRRPVAEVVPGDIICLEAGDRVGADVRLLEVQGLEVDESALTGESLPASKQVAPIAGEVPVGDQRNMAFQGTVVTRGRGLGVVVATGMATHMGEIAGMIQEAGNEPTPLQKRLAALGKWLVIACAAVCALVAGLGMARGQPLYEMFMAGVSLAVAAIPEGLPAIVTVALAVGVQRMSQRQAIVRRLPAVETLGCATYIASDKTGTLTQNKMVVRRLVFPGREVEVSGEGYVPEGEFREHDRPVQPDPQIGLLLTAAAACNNATLQQVKIVGSGWLRQRGSTWRMDGDPTEGALLVAAAKGGIWRESVESKEPRLAELPFDAERKMMSVISRRGAGVRAWVKGAPDVVLEACTGYFNGTEVVPLTSSLRAAIRQQNNALATAAYRVLGLAYRDLPPGPADRWTPETVENELVFVGLAAMLDPPRPEAVRAIEVCHRAGIKTAMITGDHQLTAVAIARQMGLARGEIRSLTGREIDALSDEELAELVEDVTVYARVSPQHKLKLVRACAARGHVVAMTGDGVNDAPAVKEAHIGIAMGQSGAEVTKEAAALILGDDNFATITAAIEEGRGIYNNIRKFIQYLISCNVGEVLTMMVAVLWGLPLPLMPIQILWMNLVTDGLPAMALGLDRPEARIMQQPPRSPRESIFAHGLGMRILVRGTLIALSTFFIFILALLWSGNDLLLARTMAFATLVFAQLFYALECSGWGGRLPNPYLLLAVGISAVMQVAVIYWPPLQVLFTTAPLNGVQLLFALTAAGVWTVLAVAGKIVLEPVWRRLVILKT